MKKNILTLGIAATLLVGGCEPNQNTAKTTQPEAEMAAKTATAVDVPFVIAKNYFVSNEYADAPLHLLQVTEQAAFDKVFGMARVMGEDGKPTPIDFSKQYVIACIGQTTDKATTLAVEGLQKSDNTLTVLYNETIGEKQSFSSRQSVILLVDKQYTGEVKLQKK